MPPDLTFLLVAGGDRFPELEHLGEGGEPLLTVEDQSLRTLVGGEGHALHRAYLEACLPARLQQHHRADGERAGDAHQERPDVLVVPDPAPLEVGQLDFPGDDLVEELPQFRLGRVEGGHGLSGAVRSLTW